MTEETFARELARRAEALPGPQLSFEDVRGRAHAIRRRRRAGVAGAVAAVVAAAIIVPTVLTGGSDRSAPDPAPPVPGHLAVLHAGQVELPDGSTVGVKLDNEDVSQFGVLTDGRIVAATSRPHGVQVFSPDGELQATYPVQLNVITMSPRDDAVAWVAEDFSLRVLESGAAEPRTLPGIPMPGEAVGSIDAVLDAEHLLVGDHNTTTGEVTPDGFRERATAEPLRVTDVSPDGDTWAVSFPPGPDQQYGCVGLYDPGADEVVARSCDIWGLEFSPDGEHLLGGFYENNMAGEVDILDLALNKVGSYRPAPQVVSRAAWADATHVLVSVADLEDNRWSLVRVGLDGTEPEVVDGPVTAGNPEMYSEYLPSE